MNRGGSQGGLWQLIAAIGAILLIAMAGLAQRGVQRNTSTSSE